MHKVKGLSIVVLLVLLVSAVPGVVRPAQAQGTGYRLPWQYCRWQKVLQGWGGSYSHNNTQMWFAYDFSHAEGTPVRAAQSGTVAFVQAGETRCGGPEYANLANYVTIYHPDNTATLYLHLKDVYVVVGQSVSRGQTIGTAGKTGWTNCNPHLHFQRQERGGWITNSQPVYFDEYPGQQLQQGQWYQSQNYWPGDHCPTSVEAGLGSGGVVGFLSLLSILGAGVGKIIRRQGGVRAFSRWFMGALLMAGLLSGCGPLGEATRPSEETPPPGTPARAFGPEQPVGVVTLSPSPTTAEPPHPTPLPIPTPQPVILLSNEAVKQLTADWRIFDDPRLGIRFWYPADHQVHMVISEGWVTLDITRSLKDPIWGPTQETFISLFLWERMGAPIATPEELQQWVSSLPSDMDPVGGDFAVVGEVTLPYAEKAWTVRWEPLPGNPEVVVDSVVILSKNRMIWVNLGAPTRQDRQEVWPRQMAFLATLEVTWWSSCFQRIEQTSRIAPKATGDYMEP